jgi:hypothetical protein
MASFIDNFFFFYTNTHVNFIRHGAAVSFYYVDLHAKRSTLSLDLGRTSQ